MTSIDPSKGMIKDQGMSHITVDTPLKNFVFQNCTFEHVNFVIYLQNVDFKSCTFTNVSFLRVGNVAFMDCKLHNVSFSTAHTVYRPKFNRCTVVGCNLNNIVVRHGTFHDTVLENVSLEHGTLAQTELRECRLNNVSIGSCSMKGVALYGVVLRKCDLTFSAWTRCYWGENVRILESRCDNMVLGSHLCEYVSILHSSLANAIVTNSTLKRTLFKCSELQQCKWSHCILAGLRATECDWKGFSMNDCVLHGPRLQACRMEAGEMSNTQFFDLVEKACSWTNTVHMNVTKTFKRQVRCICVLYDGIVRPALDIQPYSMQEKLPACELVVESECFYVPRETDFIQITLPTPWIPYSNRTDVFDIVESIQMENGGLFCPETRRDGTAGFKLVEKIKRRHSY
jgi:uncharacterized protein YjbI with pentapeptide repeats